MDSDQEESSEGRCLLDEVQTRKLKNAPMTSGFKCAIMASCLASVFLAGGVSYGLGVILPELVTTFDAPRTEAAMVQSLYFGISLGLGGFLWLTPISRFGEGVCVVAGGVLAAVGLMISSTATSIYTVIVFTGIVSSIGMSSNYIAPLFLVPDIFHGRESSSLIVLSLGTSLGQTVLPFAFEYTLSSFRLSGSLLIIGAIVLNTVPSGLVMYFTMKYYNKQNDKTMTIDIAEVNRSGSDVWQLFKETISDKCVNLLMLTCLLISFTVNFESWFIVDLLVSRGYERERGSFIVSMLGVANIVSRVLATFIRIRLRVQTLFHWTYVTLLLALSHVLVLVLHEYWAIFVACMLFGTCVGMIVSQAPAVVLEIVGPERYRTVLSIAYVVFGIGDILSGLLAGVLKDATGSYDLVLWSAVGASLLMTFLVTAIIIINKKNKGRRPEGKYVLLEQ